MERRSGWSKLNILAHQLPDSDPSVGAAFNATGTEQGLPRCALSVSCSVTLVPATSGPAPVRPAARAPLSELMRRHCGLCPHEPEPERAAGAPSCHCEQDDSVTYNAACSLEADHAVPHFAGTPGGLPH
jgi:hypothetical protein